MTDTNVFGVIGKTLSNIHHKNGKEIIFFFDNGEKYFMNHEQCCCEQVYIKEIDGDLNDLIGHPLTMAEKVCNVNYEDDESWRTTWTFFKFATIKGYVVITWFGESNGFYSEDVSFEKM